MAKIGEGAISSGLGRFFDIIIIGILTFVCSLPVITMGAAITAAYDVYIRMALDKDSHVVSTYFRAFGKNFLKATIIHLIVGSGFCRGVSLSFLFRSTGSKFRHENSRSCTYYCYGFGSCHDLPLCICPSGKI